MDLHLFKKWLQAGFYDVLDMNGAQLEWRAFTGREQFDQNGVDTLDFIDDLVPNRTAFPDHFPDRTT